MSILEKNADLSDLIRGDEHAQALIAESQERHRLITRALSKPVPVPKPLIVDSFAISAFPLEVMPLMLREAIEAIAYHVQAPIGLAAPCVLGVAAYLAQTRVNAPHLHKSEGMPCSLNILTLAASGDRKSECRRLAFLTVDEAEALARKQHKIYCDDINRSAENLRGRQRSDFLYMNPLPLDPRTQFTDATFEPIAGAFIRGMAAACWDTDEGGQVLGGASLKAETRAATLGGLVRIFDIGCIERTRAGGNIEGSGFAFHRRLSMHLLAQSVTVESALCDALLQGQGFLPRFLLFSPQSLAGTRMLTTERLQQDASSDSRLQRFWFRCREIQTLPSSINELGEITPPVLSMDSGAQEIWLSFYNQVEAGQALLGEYAGLKPFAGRAGELVRRLSAVLALFVGSNVIDEDIVKCACAVVQHSLGEWGRYLERANPDSMILEATALMRWLHEKKWSEFDFRKLQNSGPSGLRKSSGRLKKIVGLLTERHHLLTADGRNYRLNPLATSATYATGAVA